jgi:hypothetical protein
MGDGVMSGDLMLLHALGYLQTQVHTMSNLWAVDILRECRKQILQERIMEYK